MRLFSSDSDTARPSPCEPWKFWASAAWGVAAAAVYIAVQSLFGAAILGWWGVDASSTDIGRFVLDGTFVALVTLAAAPAEIVLIALAVWWARCGFSDYLALVWPERRDLVIGLACLLVLLPLADLVSYLSGRDVVPLFVREAYRTARDANALPLLALAVVAAAPIAEEIVFRGFLLPGFAASRLGPAGAIVLTSAGWAAMHMQYELFFIGHIFALGLLFGWLRWRSGSTTLTILLHALVNLTSLVQTAIVIEWLS